MGTEPIETLDLETFLAVARNESIGGAAQELRLSSPSVSTRIAALERKLGVVLFDRTTRGSFPTPAGDRFREYARRCLELLQEAHVSARSDARDEVTIAAPASLGNVLLGPTLRLLYSAGVAANGRIADTPAVIDQLLDGAADIGFVVNGIVPRGLTSQRISRSSVLPIVRPEHQLLRTDQLTTIDDMNDFPVAIYRWHSDAEALGHVLSHARRVSPKPTVYVGLPTAIIELILTADYVGLVAEFAVAHHLRRHEVRRLPLDLPTWTVDVDLVYRRNSAKWPAIQVLLDNLRELNRVIVAHPRRDR